MTRNEYNGWTNYETWLVSLWMGNNEESDRNWRRAGRTAESIQHLADAMEEDHAALVEQCPAGLAQDLMNAALSEVNWREIATSYMPSEAEVERE